MKKVLFPLLVVVLVVSLFLIAAPVSAKGFVHGIVVNVDGEDYYLAGAPDGPGGAFDVPGHDWVQAGPNKLVGKHITTLDLSERRNGGLLTLQMESCCS